MSQRSHVEVLGTMIVATLLVTLLSGSFVASQAPVHFHTASSAANHTQAVHLTKVIRIVTKGQSSAPSIVQLRKPAFKQTRSCKNVQYRATASGQGATIRSPNWPYAYPANQDCSYFVSSPPGTQITIGCDVNIACTRPNDYIFWSLKGDPNFGDSVGYCGNGQIREQTSEGNSLSIGFHSESGLRWPSWRTYRWKCQVRVIDAVVPVTPRPTTTEPPVVPDPTTTSPPVGPGPDCNCGIRNENGVESRIVGGMQTKQNELPWRVGVFVYDPATGSGGICGGTIISRNWVMSAAHCTMDFQRGDAVAVYTEAQENPITVGDGVENTVDRFIQHPAFSRQTFDNDIVLLHLQEPLTFKSTVSPACLPFSPPLSTSDHDGATVLASGWGTTRPVPVNTQNNDPVSETLLEVSLPVLTTAQCRQYQSLTVNQFCTYEPGKDTCQGDSGGSIDYRNPQNSFYYAIGITSFGSGCAQENAPGAYTKVNNYRSWIESTTGETFCQPA